MEYKTILRKSRVSVACDVGVIVKYFPDEQVSDDGNYFRVYIQIATGRWCGQTIEKSCLEYPENIVGGKLI